MQKLSSARVLLVCVAAVGFTLVPVSPASARHCVISGTNPIEQGHQTVADGTLTCLRTETQVVLGACLELNGVIVTCDTDVQDGSSSASVHVNFPCVPGLWSVVYVGRVASELDEAPYWRLQGPVLFTQCDPLRP